jgi:thioredoxin:protein disulfide reductase
MCATRHQGHSKLSPLLIFLALSLFGTETPAEDQINQNPLKVKARFESSSVAPGSQSTLYLDLTLAEEHKAFVDMFKLKWKNPSEVKVTGFTVDPSFKFEDKYSGKVREGMKGKARLSAIVEFPENLKLGAQDFEFEFGYQACTDTYCHFPKTVTLMIPVRVVDAASFRPGEDFPQEQENTLISALNRGTIYAFFFVFLAGILTSLTPCIFPMIPITLAIIGARAANQPKFKSFSLSLTYVLGIALTYAILGVIAARTGSLFGSYLGHPLVVSVIAILFVAMGLSMYGLYDLQVPSFITQRVGGGKATAGYLGAFTTGLVAGVVASPCVGPVLVSILTYVAESQNLVLGFSLLLTFALGLGMLFLVLGTFSGLLKYLPKSGPWMEFVKFVFGSFMIGAAIWYLKPVLSERLFFAVVALTLVMVASGFGVFEKVKSSRLEQVKKGFLILLLITGLSYAAKAVWYKDSSAEVPLEISKKLNWQPYSDSLLMSAKKDKRPVILDFWAEWCVACKELEMFTFSQQNIRDLSKDFTLLKLDATKSSELVERLKSQHGVVGLPAVFFYNSKGELKRELTLTGFENALSFEKRMQRALQE